MPSQVVRGGCRAASLNVSRVASVAGTTALAVIGGCSSPFHAAESDRARSLPLERFREVRTIAPTPAPPRTVDPLAPPRRPQMAQTIELSLEQCRAAAMTNNLDLKVALIAPTIANESLTEAEAAFEATFGLSGTYAKTDAPTSSSLQDAQAEFQRVEPSVQIPLRTGGTASISLPINRTKTNNPFTTLNPSYTSDLQFSLSHSLLRGAGRFAATYGILIASYGDQIAQAQAKIAVINQLASVDRAYWAVYQLRRELDVRQRQFEVAQAQLETAQRRLDAGAGVEIDVVRAEAGVANSLDAIIQTENALFAQQRQLKRIINMPDLDVDSPAMIVPITDPDPMEYVLDSAALVGVALAERMELLELELRLAMDAAGIRYQENQALPTLDLNASYVLNGLGGSLNDSLEVMAENDFEDWSIGFRGSLPLGNEAAKSRIRSAVLSRMQRLATKQSREQTVRQEVFDAVDSMKAGWQRILAARQSVILNGRALEAEQRQFAQGVNTSNDVLDASARLADAQSAEIRAIVDYQNAQMNLAVATGMVTGAARVRWAPAESPELEGPFFAPRAER